MSPRLRAGAIACALAWLVPVVGFFVWMSGLWFGQRSSPDEDPHGYVMLFGIMLAIPAAVFGVVAPWALWSLARRRRGAGGWLLTLGILGAIPSAGILPGAFARVEGPGTPGHESPSWPNWSLLATGLIPLALAVATVALASRIIRVERPLRPPVSTWQPPVAPGH